MSQPPQDSRRKPEWLKIRPPSGENYLSIKERVTELKLHTVCQEASCPNIGECWGGGTATLMLMGDTCTRGCRFCHIKTAKNPNPLDPHEPEKVSGTVEAMNLEYVVLTSVDRDDLEDGGSNHFGETIRAIKRRTPKVIVEVLIPDFQGNVDQLRNVVEAGAEVVAHNIETVESLTPKVRDRRATYRQSLKVLADIKAMSPQTFTKTSIMLGLGETRVEVMQALKDLRAVNCDIVTFGQYLQPTQRHLKVVEFVPPSVFEEYKLLAEAEGFLYVASGPLVRSSYRAGEFFIKGVLEKQGRLNASEPTPTSASDAIEGDPSELSRY
jgi:lipoic acid synthetase